MEQIVFGKLFLAELQVEDMATRKCIERIPESTYEFKPHERSMNMGYLTLLVSEMPNWIASIIEDGEIDLATYGHFQLSTSSALLKHYDDNMKRAKKALENVSNEELAKPFTLKRGGTVLFTSSKQDNIGSTINHQVHHRGQLTVYMRLNNIDVPSIYGPSADEKTF